ncbi:hypothetical protein NMY22_g2101 [Coprinellus aureogranulatus]|nr:hypothetical protein NMY22_g2101 [Coprinellus aureogranulatus]
MEPYLHTSHCRSRPPNPYAAYYVKADMLLLDGSPPKPLYQLADFEKLYELQRRMVEQMLNASVSNGTIMLQSFAKDAKNKRSLLSKLWWEVHRRDPRKERVLQNVLYTGARLGMKMAAAHHEADVSVGEFIDSNQAASEGIGRAMENQPRNWLTKVVAPLFPQARSSFWAWDTDLEIRWQFYDSLTIFSWMLYRNLMILNDVLPRIESFGTDLNALQSLLTQKDVKPVKPPDPTSKTGLLSTLFKTDRPENGAPLESDAEKNYEAMKKTVLDGFARNREAAQERVRGALVALRALSDEMDDMMHRISSPGPRLPLHDHLRHLYAEAERLSGILNVVNSFGEKASHCHCSCN